MTRHLLSCPSIGLLAALLLAAATPAVAQTNWTQTNQGEQRTANRDVNATINFPDWMIKRPDYYEFTPMVSNHDPLHSHDAQWAGQEWDTAQWPKSWTADKALNKFFAAGIFTGQNIGGKTRDVTLGPTFYKLSTLDQNRTLKLLTDQAGAFSGTQAPVMLRDHATRKPVGSYAPTGLQLF